MVTVAVIAVLTIRQITIAEIYPALTFTFINSTTKAIAISAVATAAAHTTAITEYWEYGVLGKSIAKLRCWVFTNLLLDLAFGAT